jgi:hypothetical protein
VNARRLFGSGNVDAANTGMGVWATQDASIDLSGQSNVGSVAGASGNFLPSFQPRVWLTDDEKLGVSSPAWYAFFLDELDLVPVFALLLLNANLHFTSLFWLAGRLSS